MHDRTHYNKISGIELKDRSAVRNFWLQYLPDRITNSVGIEEDVFAYILRHTHMLPRQILTIFSSIAQCAQHNHRTMFAVPFTEEEIVTGIQNTERTNADAIIGMFEPFFGRLRDALAIVLPTLPRVFSYGELHSSYLRARGVIGASGPSSFLEFWRLMLNTGAIGVAGPSASTSIYVISQFEFNSKHELIISEKDELCIHPMFSRIYNSASRDTLKLILPRGADEFDEA